MEKIMLDVIILNLFSSINIILAFRSIYDLS